jgi:hypothetical protein
MSKKTEQSQDSSLFLFFLNWETRETRKEKEAALSITQYVANKQK